jgi:hypothetical protein
MHFDMKNYLKSNRYYTVKHIYNKIIDLGCTEIDCFEKINLLINN